MAAKKMPVKLMVVVALMAIGAIGGLVAGALLDAGIAIALIVGVLVGNDGVRGFLRWAALIGGAWRLVVIAAAAQAGLLHGMIAVFMVIGVASDGFLFWALGQEDVREWMFRKNFHLDDSV